MERTANNEIITGFEYTYDSLSRIVEEKHLAENIKLCYTYDSLSRVTKRQIIELCCNEVIEEENYTYDAAGNITDAPDSCFEYDTNNRLTVFNGNCVSYDLDGNMVSDGCDEYEYDSANRLLKADGNAYTYNAEDVRIRNVRSDADTVYTYNTNCKLSQLLQKTTNDTTTKYVYGIELIGEEKCSEFKTYHFDYRGSTVAITDECGCITDTLKYDTYGNITEHSGDSFVIFGYNGRDGVITDSNGLIYMRARYYSPLMRRFVNADIIHGEISDSTSLNRYAYVNGNPVSFVDPFGLSKERGSKYYVIPRSDINGIGLMSDGGILFGINATNADVYALIAISEMTIRGESSKEILKFVDKYVKSQKNNTVIKKGKLLDYYTNFQDITDDLTALMLRNEYMYTMYPSDNTLKSIYNNNGSWLGGLGEFKNNVQKGGIWDLKQYNKWQNSSLYYFNGKLVDADAPGNIMYGYMGKAYGIPDSVLYYGAGYAQYMAGNARQEWFYIGTGDDPIDTLNIELGIDYYNKLHS